MTNITLLREPNGSVVGIVRILVVSQMASHARGAGQTIISVRVALCTLHARMEAGKRPTCSRVIECGRSPVRGAVAHFALLREACRNVIRIVRPLEIFKMATHARRDGDVVVSIDVALSTLQRGMSSGQRERGLGMVERRRLPGCCRVAHIALLRNARGNVVWIRRALIVLQVTRDTDCGSQIEISIRVALIALQLRVSTSEGEAHRVMIEVCGLPRRGCVAFLAGLGKPQCDVIWIVRLLKIGQVAAYACRRRALVLSTGVACRAVERSVHSGKRKASDPQMIELRAKPGVNRVALLTLHGKSGGDVIRLRGLLIGALVAGITLDGKSLELPDRLALVAVRAV